MKRTNYRRPSLRALVAKLQSEKAIREFAAKVQEGIDRGHIRMSADSVRKMNEALTERRAALRAATLYGPDGNPIVR